MNGNLYHITQINSMRSVQYTERSYAPQVFLVPGAIACVPEKMSKAKDYDRYYRVIDDGSNGLIAVEFWQGDTVRSLISRVTDEGYANNDSEAFDDADYGITQEVNDFKEWSQDYIHDVNNYRIEGTNLLILEKEVGAANAETVTIEVKESNAFGGRPAGTYSFDVVISRYGQPIKPDVEQSRPVAAAIKAWFRQVEHIQEFGAITFMGVEYNGNWNML